MSKIVIYTTPDCPYCHAVKALLRSKGVAYEEIDVDGDAAARARLAKITGERTVPQIFIDGRSYGGFSDISALDAHGELDRLLRVA